MTPTRLIDATPVTDDWWLIRLPWADPVPQPGQWLWMENTGQRRCLPVRDADAGEGWLAGVLPAACLPGDLGPGTRVGVSALHGEPVTAAPEDRLLRVGEDLGIGPALALAERQADQVQLLLLGGRHGVPARLAPSRFLVPGLADTAIAGIAGLEEQGVAARIACAEERPGVYEGPVFDLVGRYLSEMTDADRRQLRLIAFGPWGELQQRRDALTTGLRDVQVVELPTATH